MSDDVLTTRLTALKGVGPKTARLFSKKGIDTFEDALYFLPRGYEDRTHVTPIRQLTAEKPATVFGRVFHTRLIGRGRSARLEVKITDDSGTLSLIWFHGASFLANEFQDGEHLLVYGEIRFFHGVPTMAHPEYEKAEAKLGDRLKPTRNFGRIVPIYSEGDGLSQKIIRKVMTSVVDQSLPALIDPLPESLRSRLGLVDIQKSFRLLHHPDQLPVGPEDAIPPELLPAIRRIVFEEFFCLQLGLGIRRRTQKKRRAPAMLGKSEATVGRFLALLPFTLTADQKQAVDEIARDLKSGHAMCRLVQGDVGSGKTVVALAAAAMALGNGYQVAFMVPTEILANQHYLNAKRWLEPLGYQVAMAVSGASRDAEFLQGIKSGKIGLVIGTHALFQKNLEFHKLGLVIVDEQHRFGVDQRAELMKKGGELPPHLLMMTATPIPRTLALTLYGDLELTLIRQKPAGRKKVATQALLERDRPRLYAKLRAVVERGEQAFIIYPLVEESEKLDLKSATQMFQKLSREIFPEFRMALLHGRLEGEEKDLILRKFRSHEYDILVSTTVIEVGIDVPNATLMVIEHPERLGLSQLHQLRGRVGRGEAGGECLFLAEKFIGERLRIMERSDDGFVIAEEDLKLRGPGEFLGKRQSGLPGFRVGHLVRDGALLSLAREEAERVLETDPYLQSPEHRGIRALVESRWKGKLDRLSH